MEQAKWDVGVWDNSKWDTVWGILVKRPRGPPVPKPDLPFKLVKLIKDYVETEILE